MRELKFRAWTIKHKCWHYFDLITLSNGVIDREGDGMLNYECWCQYTGLQDKNGKDIYEGDICIINILGDAHLYNKIQSLTVRISFQNAAWGFMYTNQDLCHADDKGWHSFWMDEDKAMWREKYFEVIGNIRENPALLDEGRGNDI